MPNGKLPTNTFLEGKHFTTLAILTANLSFTFKVAAGILPSPFVHVFLDLLRA
jgi:hypothetical protein